MALAPSPVPVVIFISYAADDPQWPSASVAALANKLREAGAEVLLDQWEVTRRGRRLSDREWRDWVRGGLDSAHHVVCLCSTRYDQLWLPGTANEPRGRGVAFESFELAQQLYDSKQLNDGRVFLFHAEAAAAPRDLQGRCPPYFAPYDEALLIDHLCHRNAASDHDACTRRLRAILEDEKTALYVPLAGQQQQPARNPVKLPQSVMAHLQDLQRFAAKTSTEHPDVLDAVKPDTRALLLGQPGAGKTFALLKVLEHDLDDGRIPVWIKLNHWLDGDLPFGDFVAREAPDLGTAWADVLTGEKRGHLLLDGLNELPAQFATKQREQIAAWLQAHPRCGVLVSCREEDLPGGEFEFVAERLVVKPLRAQQIRQFVDRYYEASDAGDTDDLFWRLVGDDALRRHWASRPAATPDAAIDAFIEAEDRGAPWLAAPDRDAWRAACRDPGRPYPLATNPYLLLMLLGVWALDRAMPIRQRVDLFEAFTLARVRDEIAKRHATLKDTAVQDWLAGIAARMQALADTEAGAADASTVSLPWSSLDDTDLRHAPVALGAGLLRREGSQLRFRHQLLQEFYVARYLNASLGSGESTLLAATWGKDVPLWERSGWKQPFLLLAEYQHTAIPDLLRTLVRVQPEVAGAVWEQARARSPGLLSDSLAEELGDELSAKMLPATPSADFPKREAAFGRGLGLMLLPDGRPLDRRPGVWGWHDRGARRTHVDIDWVPIAAGKFVYQGAPETIGAFSISRYPITVSQFRAFADDPLGFADDRWWENAPTESREAWHPRFAFGNHPATDVDWWQAGAFCRWLSELLGQPIALPTERQWERAAAGGGAKAREYPWRGGWKDRRANADGEIGQTSAVGMFPDGASDKEGVHDLAGNVWEWTSNRFDDDGAADEGDDTGPRAVRGGSWGDGAGGCRATYRDRYPPDFRYHVLGFRVVCCPIKES